MKKKLIIFCLLMMMIMPCVKGKDYSGGTSGSIRPSGDGGWNDQIVAIRVSIVSSSGTLEDVRYFTNSNILGAGAKCFSESKPKTHQTKTNEWVSCSELIKDGIVYQSSSFSYTDWNPSGISINIYKGLSDSNYKNLKELLNFTKNDKKIFTTLSPGDFIIVEPMAHFDGFTGTAYEFATSFLDTGGCNTEGSFCWEYAGVAFSGSRRYKQGGFFYSTIYLEETVTINNITLNPYIGDSGIYYSCDRNDEGVCTNGENQIKRINEFKNQKGGLGIGVFEYDKIFDKLNALTIEKVDEAGEQITSGYAYFNVYDNSNCSGTPIREREPVLGRTTIKLSSGTYSIKEVTAPDGYFISEECEVVNLPSAEPVRFTNRSLSDCNLELTALGESPEPRALFALYSKYQKNGLLDLSNPRCEYVSCTGNPTEIKGCLTATSNTSYADDSNFYAAEPNLSCFDVKETGDNYVFCNSTAYTLTNNFPVSKFYGKNGNFLIKKDSSNSYIYYNSNFEKQSISSAKGIATAKRVNVCYSINSLTSDQINNYVKLDSTDFEKLYFGMNDYTGRTDNLNTSGYGNALYDRTGTLKRYRYTYYIDYDFLPFYFKKITGEYRNIRTQWTTSEKVYGLLSKFNDEKEGEIPFQLGNLKPTKAEQKCWYELEPEIIIENKLQLEFRTIDTTKPFNRNTKSNWCDGSSCDENNSTVQTYITNQTNSYGFKNGSTERQQPIWKITLTPNDIKLIREYNKDHPYDNYNIYCNGKAWCESSFLGNLKQGFLRKYAVGEESVVAEIKISEYTVQYGNLSNNLKGNIKVYDYATGRIGYHNDSNEVIFPD